MRKIQLVSVLALLVSLSSCQLAVDIFKTGFKAGVLLVIIIVGLVIFILAKIFGGSK